MPVMTELRFHRSGQMLAFWHGHPSTVRANDFQRIIDASDFVFIDVFGTALARAVPEHADVFDIVAFRLKDRTEPYRFRDARVRAEASLRRHAFSRSREVGVHLGDIYARMADELPAIDPVAAMQQELEVERAVAFADPTIRKLHGHLRQVGKRIVFSTDSALPQSFVGDLLCSVGYPEADVVSVRHARTSFSTETDFLERSRLKETKNARVVHIGNGRPASGVRTPRRRRNREASLGTKVLARLETLALAEPSLSRDERLFRKLGYGLAGPIFLGLTQWLADEVRREPTDVVLFCARDGFFVRQVYERFARFVALPPSRYFEVSRRALVFPCITELDERSLDILCSNIAPIPAAEYFSRIGIDIAQFPLQLAEVGLTGATVVYSDAQRVMIRRLFERLEDVVVARARDERPLLFEYLDRAGCFEAANVTMFDIGWGGTLQEALGRALAAHRSATRLRGYYLSTDERIKKLSSRGGRASGWFTNGGEPDHRQQPINDGYWSLELMFSGPHGTILGYQRASDGGVEAVRRAFDDSSPNARATLRIQNAALELIDRWTAIFEGCGPVVPVEAAFERYLRFIRHPTPEEATYFGSLVHVGGLGATAEESPVVAVPSLREIVANPRAVLLAYQQSDWQLVYLSRLFRSVLAARVVLNVRSFVRNLRRVFHSVLMRKEAS